MRKFSLFFALFFASIVRAQLSVPITVQPAEWQDMGHTPTGTRTSAPVTFGLGIPDSAQIDCPGTQDFPQNEGAPTKLELTNSGGTQISSQFRCMGRWPDGFAEWVLVDAQLASFVESSGFDSTSIVVKQVASGGGNNPATTLATLCTTATVPVASCSTAGNIVVNTGAAVIEIQSAGYNLFNRVRLGGTYYTAGAPCTSSDLVCSASGNFDVFQGLYLSGPPDAALSSGTVDSVSCWWGITGSSGPIGANGAYIGSSICNASGGAAYYTSANDASSTCTIEENGPLRATVMCQGNMVNSSGHTYLHWRTRSYFYASHSDVKVTIALRNADVCTPNTNSFCNGYKEFGEFEARLLDNLGTTRNYAIGTPAAAVTATGFTASQYAYSFQGFSANGLSPDWTNAINCKLEADNCVTSYVARTNAPIYALDGGQVNQNSTTPSTVWGSASTPASPNAIIGYLDLDDGSNGIEVGHYQMPMYFPKALELQPTPPGATSGNEIRVSIWPNQQLAISPGTTFGTNTIQNPAYTLSGACSPAGNCNSQPITSYSIGWPQYQIHDTYWNFHAGIQSTTVAANNFLYFQHPLLARPQSGTYYNTVRDAGSGFDALFYDIPDPIQEDMLYIGLGSSVCNTSAGQCLPDVNQQSFPYCGGVVSGHCTGTYSGMKAFRNFIWTQAGGSNGTQFEQREAFLRNWLQRGGAGTTGSVPGRYIWASHWYRMIVEKSLPRSDSPSTFGSSAGLRQYCTSIGVCAGLGFESRFPAAGQSIGGYVFVEWRNAQLGRRSKPDGSFYDVGHIRLLPSFGRRVHSRAIIARFQRPFRESLRRIQ